MGKSLQVPYLEQTEEWPAGDECLCAVMLLRYLGIQLTVNEFVDFFLPQEQMRRKNGELIGPDPNVKFAGSPYDKSSFGCYPKVIVSALNECFEQKGLLFRAEDATGMSTDELLENGIANGTPVLYWASEGMRPTHPGYSWKRSSGEGMVQWIEGSQCMLLVGSDVNKLIFNDPKRAGRTEYARMAAVKRHSEVKKFAVLVRLA